MFFFLCICIRMLAKLFASDAEIFYYEMSTRFPFHTIASSISSILSHYSFVQTAQFYILSHSPRAFFYQFSFHAIDAVYLSYSA